MFKELVKMVKACGVDVRYYYDADEKCLDLTIYDFIGFDEDWSEQFREFEHEEAVEDLIEWLEDHCEEECGDFYHYYEFEGFEVCLGYTSCDI